MRLKHLVLLVFVFFLLVVSVSAVTEITATSIDNEVNLGDEATFNLKITNRDTAVRTYSLYSFQSGQGWTVDPRPLTDKVFSLAPSQSRNVEIVARALGEMSPGIYYVTITIETDKGERFNEALKVYLGSRDPQGYLPSILINLDMDEKLSTRSSVPIKLFLENRNALDLTGLKVKIQSDMSEFNKEAVVDLLPLQKKTVEFTITPNKYQQPKDYSLFFVFERPNGDVVKVLEQKVEILPLLPDFTLEVGEEIIFLKKFRSVTIKNDGNVKNTQEVALPVSFFDGLFTSNVEVKKVKELRSIVWEATLGPNEEVTVYTVTNYRLALYVLLIILLLVGFYYYVQSPIVVTKKAVSHKNEDGTLSEIKVILEIKNRSKKPLMDVIVNDTVPGIANVQNSLQLGTLKPSKINYTKNGTKVTWSLAELDYHEHRLITYKIKAKLNIVGTFVLPRITVDYKRKSGRKGKAYSNIFRLSN